MSTYVSKRDSALTGRYAVVMTVAIIAIGFIMMTLTSSPTVKGASFLWLPAALQLAAGVWLGPWWGLFVGGIGAYGAGILAYGGWGIVDIIMNPIAGGFANSMLPYFLFVLLRINPTMGVTSSKGFFNALGRTALLTGLVFVAGLANVALQLPQPFGWAIPFVVLIVGAWYLFKGLNIDTRSFLLAVFVAVFISGVSALIGAVGATVGGKPFAAALVDPGIGWFSGDVVSALVGVFILMLFTQRMRDAGISRL